MNSEIVKQQNLYNLNIAQASKGIKIAHQLGKEEWGQFVDRHPQGNIFHTPEMYEVFQQTLGYHPDIWAAVSDEGNIEALFLPVQVTLNNRLRRLTTRAISYGSVLCSPSIEGRQALSVLLDTYVHENRASCLFTELRNLSGLETEQPILRQQGFAYEDHLNYLIDLNLSPEEVFMNIGARTRKNIKRGLHKSEVTIREVTNPDQIGTCYDLLKQTYQAARVPLVDRSLFDAAFELLYPKKMVRFALASIGETPVAVSIELLYKDVMYGWFGGMDRAYSKYNPNEMLMWNVLKWGAENHYRVYDFGGAGKPTEEYGVRDFKAKFGGELVCYGRNTYVHMPGFFWLSKQGYNVLRYLFNGRISFR